MEKRLNFKILIDSPDFENPKPELEQYSTPVDIAIDIIKKINSRGLLSGKVADLGCGTGLITKLILNKIKKDASDCIVYAVDHSSNALKTASEEIDEKKTSDSKIYSF